MPEFICPQCANDIRLPESYAWYDGEVRCSRCQSTIRVQIGDYTGRRGTYVSPTTRPWMNLQGGLLLTEPAVVEIGPDLPEALLAGTDSDEIPYVPRKAMRTAVWAYRERRYEDATVRCRVTLEAALLDHGITKDSPRLMVKQALTERLLTDTYGKLCEAVTALGGAAAHPDAPEIEPAEAMLCIGITGSMLRRLYRTD